MLFDILSLILLLILVQRCKTDILYQEGFSDFENQPGGSDDPLNRPNTPFSTDTNRFADGITSTAAYDSTSPRFPVYRGSSANNSERYRNFIAYSKSAEEQGIGLSDVGDARREDARVKITSQSNYQDLPAPTKTFTVYSAIKWNPSDFAIQAGEEYNITVFGSQSGYSEQFWFDGGLRVNAEGYRSYFDAISNCYVGMGRCRPHLKKRRRLQTANWMSLACAIGRFVRPLTEVEPGREEATRWLPLDESTLEETIFEVGRTVQFKAVHSGQLICFANDAHSLYWNNFGDLQVTVTRVSWPPKNETVYQVTKLPACDSAQVVYVNRGNNTPGDGRIECNPAGGGSGWKLEDVLNRQGTFGSGAPESIYFDLPDEQRFQ